MELFYNTRGLWSNSAQARTVHWPTQYDSRSVVQGNGGGAGKDYGYLYIGGEGRSIAGQKKPPKVLDVEVRMFLTVVQQTVII